MSRFSPVRAFERVTMRQAIEQRCFDFEPNTVEAGADREITVTAELENTKSDRSFDHVWRIEIDGDGIGFTTTTVPPGETVRDSQTQVIPRAMLPVDGGSVSVVIQQIGGFRQTARCGNLEVTPTEKEPVQRGDIVLTDLRVPSTVEEGERATIEIDTECRGGFCEAETLTLTVDGRPIFTGGSTGAGPFREGRTRTFTAPDVMFDRPGTSSIVAELDGERLTESVTVTEVEDREPPEEVEPIDGEPTAFDVQSVDAPRTAAVDERFPVTVTVACEGTGSCSGRLRWRWGDKRVPLVARDIDLTGGETREITTNRMHSSVAGPRTIVAEIRDTDARASTAITIEEAEAEEEEEEAEFDLMAIQVVPGTCSMSPREGPPDQPRTFAVEVENGNPATAAKADIHWALQDEPGGPVIARTTVPVIPTTTTATAQATAAPAEVDVVPDEFRSRVRAIVVPGSVGKALQRAPAGESYDRHAHARAGAPTGDGQHRPVADGGVELPAATDTALERLCGGCAERSRRLTALNRRIREAFRFG